MTTWAVVLEASSPAGRWCGDVSSGADAPHVEVRACHAIDGDRMEEVVELVGPGARERLEATRDLPTVHQVEILEDRGTRVLARLTIDRCFLADAVATTGLAPLEPFPVVQGRDRWLVVGGRDRVHEFLDRIRAEGDGALVRYVGRYEPRGLLTERQEEVLEAAVASGYYDYPRGTTLTELAEELGVAKSTLSQLLMRVEGTIMQRLVQQGEVRLRDARGIRLQP